jgi:hypothetical protein
VDIDYIFENFKPTDETRQQMEAAKQAAVVVRENIRAWIATKVRFIEFIFLICLFIYL